MRTRRTFAALLAALLPSSRRLGALQSPVSAKQIFRQDLPSVNTAGWEVTAVEVTMAPGAQSAAHRHPGFVVGYVLEGEYKFQATGQAEAVLKTGQMFYEAPGGVHMISGNASAD